MAFYIAHVDDEGNEIERKYDMQCFNAKQYSLAFPMTLSGMLHESKRPKERLTDSATRLENSDEESLTSEYPVSSSDEHRSSETYGVSSDIVPPLNITSDECSYVKINSNKSVNTFTIKKRDPDAAYQNWLDAKRKLWAKEAAVKKQTEEKKRKEIELRKVESEQKFQEWKEKKQKLKAAEIIKKNNCLEKPQKVQEPVKETDSKMKVLEWKYSKLQVDIEKRLMQEAHIELERAKNEIRRQKAIEAWNRWIAQAPYKPKPVPLNRGLDSLRGSVAKININPIEWQN